MAARYLRAAPRGRDGSQTRLQLLQQIFLIFLISAANCSSAFFMDEHLGSPHTHPRRKEDVSEYRPGWSSYQGGDRGFTSRTQAAPPSHRRHGPASLLKSHSGSQKPWYKRKHTLWPNPDVHYSASSPTKHRGSNRGRLGTIELVITPSHQMGRKLDFSHFHPLGALSHIFHALGHLQPQIRVNIPV
ncbi:hypothetical protein OJAV_G00051550 [Oryzias javanicus]|uniref:Uncharacterized protein n=1 Tax=Oryzias javanicus TaxID=123683 RepID=A0A3S2N147_ORYJA|nr:hypothetical protein OJAV_G00051550 [Oryzias javanicus]